MLSNTPPEITKEISLIPITGAKLASLIDAALTVGATVPGEIYLMQTDFINGDNSFMHVVKEITGGVYLYHGSVFKGHLHIPAEMKGAVLYGKDKAYVTDAVTTKMQERGFKVKWTEKPLRASQAYFHPIFQATLLEEFGAPYEKVLEWKEKHLTPEQINYRPPARGQQPYATTEERAPRLATRIQSPVPIATEENGAVAALLARLTKLEADMVTKDKAHLETQAAATTSSVAGSSLEHGAAPAAATAPNPSKRARST